MDDQGAEMPPGIVVMYLIIAGSTLWVFFTKRWWDLIPIFIIGGCIMSLAEGRRNRRTKLTLQHCDTCRCTNWGAPKAGSHHE